MTGHGGPSVLVVDDHPVFRRGLRALLESELAARVVETADADAARAALDGALQPHLIVVDIALPGRNGIDLISDIVARHGRDARILAVSVHPEDQYAVRALRAGASGYVSKDAQVEEVVLAARAVLGGGRHLSPALAARLEAARRAERHLHESLSDREMEVLCSIGRGHTISEIAQQLNLSVKTISTYRARILEKTGMRTNAELMRYALDNGLVH